MRSPLAESSPQTQNQIIDTYFIEHRAKILDIAAYLDRLDRGKGDHASTDFRQVVFKQALGILLSDQPHRTKRILELLSEVGTELPQSAEGMKGAVGAPSRRTG